MVKIFNDIDTKKISNSFAKTSFEYYRYILEHDKLNIKPKLFSRHKNNEVELAAYDTLNLVKLIYGCFEPFNNPSFTRETTFNTLKEFAKFLIIAKKCFFYPNYNYSSVYSEIDKRCAIKLYINLDVYNTLIIYTFKPTSIDIQDSTDSLLNFINNGESTDSEGMEIINIEIKQSDDTMSFQYLPAIPGSFTIDSEEEKMVVNNAFSASINMIFDTFTDILDNYISKIINKSDNKKIKLEEVIRWSMNTEIPLNYLKGGI